MNSTNNGSARDLISRNCLIALAALSVANVIAHLIALPSLPAQIPTHWGAGGEINGWGPSWTATALGALPLGMLVLFCVIPLIDPKGNGYARAGKFYQRFVVVFTLLMIAVSWLRGPLHLGWCCRSGDQRGLPWGMHRDVRLLLPAVYWQDSLRTHPRSTRQAQASTFPPSHDSANGSGPRK